MESHNPMYVCYNTPFQYNVNDCCLMVANYYKSTTGIDYMEKFRGKYTTQVGAYLLMKRAGGIVKILEDAGFHEVKKTFARTGDVALYDSGRILTPGIVNGSECVFAGGKTIKLSKMTSIYRK